MTYRREDGTTVTERRLGVAKQLEVESMIADHYLAGDPDARQIASEIAAAGAREGVDGNLLHRLLSYRLPVHDYEAVGGGVRLREFIPLADGETFARLQALGHELDPTRPLHTQVDAESVRLVARSRLEDFIAEMQLEHAGDWHHVKKDFYKPTATDPALLLEFNMHGHTDGPFHEGPHLKLDVHIRDGAGGSHVIKKVYIEGYTDFEFDRAGWARGDYPTRQ